RLLRRRGVLRTRLDDLLVAQLREGELAATVGDDLVRVERVLRDEVERLARRRAARAGQCSRNGHACDGAHRRAYHPPVLVHRSFLSRRGLGKQTGEDAPPTHYRGYAAVTPPSTLTTFPVDLFDRGPARNAIASATSSGRTATPSFVRP